MASSAADGEEDTRAALRSLLGRVHQGCRLLLKANQPEQCLQLLKASALLILDEPLADEGLAAQLLLGLIERCNTDVALSALPVVTPSTRAYRGAVRAFAARGSLSGVHEVMRAAGVNRLLQVHGWGGVGWVWARGLPNALASWLAIATPGMVVM